MRSSCCGWCYRCGFPENAERVFRESYYIVGAGKHLGVRGLAFVVRRTPNPERQTSNPERLCRKASKASVQREVRSSNGERLKRALFNHVSASIFLARFVDWGSDTYCQIQQ